MPLLGLGRRRWSTDSELTTDQMQSSKGRERKGFRAKDAAAAADADTEDSIPRACR
jgi:hypothetical protein